MKDCITEPVQMNAEIKIHRGLVKWFSLEKGYGFISRDGGGQDCFVHHKSIESPIRYLRSGEAVEFEIEKTEKGYRAVKVRSLNKNQ